MNGSLRDQLLNAGFEEKKRAKKPVKKTRKPTVRKPANTAADKAARKAKEQAQEDARILERKRIKAEIKALIEETREKETEGDQIYSYILGNRVKQLYVNQACHEKIANRTVAITRLNGATYLIPVETADKVKALNPDWAVIFAPDENKQHPENDDYAGFEIPDDLKW